MLEFLLVLAVIVVFALASIVLHYEALRALSYVLPRLSVRPRQKALIVVCSALVAHLMTLKAEVPLGICLRECFAI